ncbi:hypothetical protein [Sutcliffiella horikoshii]|nr:hypothetical protein [Sutcliffiella horikoshii]
MLSIVDADAYIETNVIDIEDWQEADQAKKQRIINAANTTLQKRFKKYEIPELAVYHFAAILAIVFSDINRLQQHGVAGISVTGVSSTTFKENNVKTPGGTTLHKFIPEEVYDMISELNNVKLAPRRIGRSVR